MDDCTKASRLRAKSLPLACACWQRFPHASCTAQNHSTGGEAALVFSFKFLFDKDDDDDDDDDESSKKSKIMMNSPKESLHQLHQKQQNCGASQGCWCTFICPSPGSLLKTRDLMGKQLGISGDCDD